MLRARTAPSVRLLGVRLLVLVLAGGFALAAAQPGVAAVPRTERIAGADRVSTSTTVARDRFPGGQGAAVLARGDDFADALAGTTLAHHVGGPLLLTASSHLDDRVATELRDHLRPGSTVWLLGAASALSDDVAREVEGLGFPVQRLAGRDRYETAAAIADAIADGAGDRCDVVLVTGRTFADGVAAAGLLGTDRPLLFTDGEALPAVTASALAACSGRAGEVTAVGGPAAAALDRARPAAPLRVVAVVGQDRYDTSARLLARLRTGSDGVARDVVLATGEDFADPLVGGTYGDPVLLTGPDGLPRPVSDALRAVGSTVASVVVVGGERAVSPQVERAAAAAVAGEPEPGADEADAGWLAAWSTGDHERVRAWFEAQRFGPSTITGTHPGGRVTTQAQADAMRDKRVTGNVTVDGDVTIRDVFFDGGRVDVTGGRVTFENTLHDARGGSAYPNYLRVFGRDGKDTRVHFERVEVRNGQDGIQTAGHRVTGRYVYVHSVAGSTGDLTGTSTHQDGWQHMRGDLDVERSFIDYRGAETSVLMLKPDHGAVGSVDVHQTVLQGGGPILFHVHDAGENRIERIDVSDNLVAGTPGKTLASVWQVNAGVVEQLRASTVTASPSGRPLRVVDAAKLP